MVLLAGFSSKIGEKNRLNLIAISPICLALVTSPTTYFIHCDLIDRRKNLFNGKKSNVLARFDIKEKPFKKASYHTSSQQVLRDCSTSE